MQFKKIYSCNTSFLDLLFNMLLAFVALFVLSFALINQNNNKNNFEAKAEYIVTVTWPNDYDDDVDTWVEDPDGNLVSFNRREGGLMHLDRDDVGTSNDLLKTANGLVKYNENRETVTIRSATIGEYCINLHAYRKGDGRPVKVRVQLDKLNPNFTTIELKEIVLENQGEEKTAFRFQVKPDGIVTTNQLDKVIVMQSQSPYGPPSEYNDPPLPLPPSNTADTPAPQ